MMYAADEEADEKEFAELIADFWRRKWLIGACAFFCLAIGVVYTLYLATPIYRAEAVLSPNEKGNAPSLPAGLGGLAGLANINIGSSTDTSETIATLRSNAFIEQFILDNELIPILFADEWDAELQQWSSDDSAKWPDIRDAVEFFNEDIRSVDESADTGLVVLGIEWTDPALAAQWVNQLVDLINSNLRERDLRDARRRLDYLRSRLEQESLVELRQAISGLIENEIQSIMLAEAEIEYAFKVIDPPRVPKEDVWPKGALIAAGSLAAGLMIGLSWALILIGFERRRAGSSQLD